MGITIEEINAINAKDINTCDGEFIIEARMALYLEDDEIRYKVVKTPVTRKRYRIDEVDYNAYIDNPDKSVFLAYIDGQISGQIILRKNWNSYAFIEDIVVDAKFRQQGVGREMVARAVCWARERELAGIMLETQNNNLSACIFYERCGFQLGGFDKYLYKGIDKETDEVALYWYLCFEDSPPTRKRKNAFR